MTVFLLKQTPFEAIWLDLWIHVHIKIFCTKTWIAMLSALYWINEYQMNKFGNRAVIKTLLQSLLWVFIILTWSLLKYFPIWRIKESSKQKKHYYFELLSSQLELIAMTSEHTFAWQLLIQHYAHNTVWFLKILVFF